MRVALALLLLLRSAKADQTCVLPTRNSTDFICDYISHHCGESFGIAKFYYCNNEALSSSYSITSLLLMSFFLLFVTIGIITSSYLSPNLQHISEKFNLNEKISGLTLLSLGNGSTDLFSTYQAMSQDSTNLAIGELVGSSLFLICFVIGLMGVLNPFKVEPNDFTRDVLFFSLLIFISLFFIQDGILHYWECTIMCLLYLGYLLCLIIWGREDELEELQLDLQKPIIVESSDSLILLKSENLDLRYLRNLQKFLTNNEDETLLELIKKFNDQEQHLLEANDFEISDYSGSFETELDFTFIHFLVDFIKVERLGFPLVWEAIKFPINLLLKLTIPVMPPKSNKVEFIQAEDDNILEFRVQENKKNLLSGKTFDIELTYKVMLFNYFQVLLIPFLFLNLHPSIWIKVSISVFAFVINFFLSKIIPSKLHNLIISIIGFVLTLNYITLITSATVKILKNMGVILDINESLLGLTLLSFGNSVGDLISNVTLARLGLHITGLHACFGAPLLYVLLGIGVNGLIIMFRHKQREIHFEISNNLKISCIALLCTLVMYATVVPRNGWVIGKKIGLTSILWWCLINALNVLMEIYHIL